LSTPNTKTLVFEHTKIQGNFSVPLRLTSGLRSKPPLKEWWNLAF